MKKKLSVYLLVSVLLCGICGCSQKSDSSPEKPEELIAAFMEQYFNVSLKDAQKKIDQTDTSMPMESAFTEEGLDLAAKNRTSWQMLKLSEELQSDISLADFSSTLASYSKPAFAKNDDSSRYEFEATLSFPSLSPSDELPTFLEIQKINDKETVSDTLKGYFDLTETEQGWKIQEFQLL